MAKLLKKSRILINSYINGSNNVFVIYSTINKLTVFYFEISILFSIRILSIRIINTIQAAHFLENYQEVRPNIDVPYRNL